MLGGSLYRFSSILVCFIKQACLLAIVSKFGGPGGVDDSILWLSFAQQKAYIHTIPRASSSPNDILMKIWPNLIENQTVERHIVENHVVERNYG
jgi:hypothetical protein